MIVLDSQKFKNVLLQRSLNLNTVATHCKLNPATVSKMTAQNCRVHFSTLGKVSKFLQVEPTTLIKEG